MGIGLFLAFLGKKIFKLTVLIVSTVATVGFLFILIFGIIGAKTNMIIVWVILGIGIVLGLFIGYLFVKYDKMFHFLLGGLMGYVIGLILYNFVLRYIDSNPIVFKFYILGGLLGNCCCLHYLMCNSSNFPDKAYYYTSNKSTGVVCVYKGSILNGWWIP